LLSLGAIAVVIFVVLTRDPIEPLAVVAVLAGSSVAVACAVALVGLAVEERDAALARPRARRPQRVRAVRRGVEIGALLAALGLLRAVDGLTLITGGFVVVGFVLAELVLSVSSTAARSG
jgi:heme O synthase-like polyprenyltransferase